jgi:hypothetical protein
MKLGKLLYVGSLIIASSCYTPRYVYSPSAHNVPQFERKGDSKVAGYYSSIIGNRNSAGSRVNVNRSSGLDLQGAYAITDHWAVQSSYYLRNEKNDGDYSIFNLDSTVITYKRSLIEAGLGYFSPLAKSSKLRFQLFGGLGFGNFSFTDIGSDAGGQAYQRFFSTRVTKFYLQPAMVLNPSPRFTLGFSSRWTILKFHRIRSDYQPVELNNFKLDSIGYKAVSFWEPAIVNSFNFKKLPGISFEYQFGLGILISRNFVDARPFNFSGGIVFDIRKLFARQPTGKTNSTNLGANL